MTVGDLHEVYVKGKVDESDIGKVYMGQPARITVESFKDHKFGGHVTKISPMGTEKDNVTRLKSACRFNEKQILKALMTANAEIVLEERKKVLAIRRARWCTTKTSHRRYRNPILTNDQNLLALFENDLRVGGHQRFQDLFLIGNRHATSTWSRCPFRSPWEKSW